MSWATIRAWGLRVSWKTSLLCVASTVFAQSGIELPAHDWKDAKDNPIISRFTGAVISGYQAEDYGELILPLGKYHYKGEPGDRQYEKYQTVEGKITRIVYAIPRGKTSLEVYRNYEQALVNAGFKTLYSCTTGPGCNPDFTMALIRPLLNHQLGNDNVMVWTVSGNGGQIRHLTASLSRPGGNVYVTITACDNAGPPPGVLVQIAEVKPMQTAQVLVDAKAMTAALQSEGKIALYGLYFDTDSAVVKNESKATLIEMAKLLEEAPNLKVFIVGHTDNAGLLAHNIDLSQRRADAVVKLLIADYHIAPERLIAKGLAAYSPLAANNDEAGRSKNRRVEMVAQ